MLQDMDPCPLNQTCPGNAAYVDGVALFTFPAISVATEVKSGNTVQTGPYDDTTCPTTKPPYRALRVCQCDDIRPKPGVAEFDKRHELFDQLCGDLRGHGIRRRLPGQRWLHHA